MLHVFVYGTLKRGFPFHPLGMADCEFLGEAQTLDPYPMVIAGSFFGPMMLDRPGHGLPVRGELYRVAPGQLPRLDELEDVGKPGSFRSKLRIRSADGRETQEAIGYMKARNWLRPVHTGYISDYRDTRFIPPWDR